MKRIIFILMCFYCVSITQAAVEDIVAINAESDLYYYVPGDNWQDVEDAAAVGGVYITAIANSTNHNPDADRYYSIDLPAEIYDLYVKVYVGPDAYDDDSFYVASDFGEAAGMTMWNMLADATDLDGDGVDERYGWVLYETTTYTSPGGTVTFKVSPREDGLRFDAFAFALNSDQGSISQAQLDQAVIEGDVEIGVATDPTPIKGATDVGYESGGSIDILLKWNTGLDADDINNPDPNITSHMLYYGPNDPNLELGTVVSVNIPSGYPSVANEANWLATGLDFNQLYHWRVDEIRGGDPCVTPGTLWHFTTLGQAPVVTVHPSDVLSEDPCVVQFSIEVSSATPAHFSWFKSADMEIGGDSSVGTDSNVLTVNVNAANEAFYYCVVNNDSGVPATSDFAGLWLKKEVARYKLNNDLDDALNSNQYPAEWDQADDPCVALQVFDPCAIEGSHSVSLAGDVNAFVSVPNSEDYFSFYTRGLTVSCWMKANAATGTGCLASKHALSTTGSDNFGDGLWEGWTLQVIGGTPSLEIRHGGVNAVGTTAVDDGEWHMVTAIYDYYGLEAKMYVDGELEATDDTGLSPNGVVKTPLDRFAIGSVDTNDGGYHVNPFNGLVDDVRLWTYPLTGEDVASLYIDTYGDVQNKVYICVDGILPDYDLDEDCDTDFADIALIAGTWLDCNRYPQSECGIGN
jgi:hypothetical protein